MEIFFFLSGSGPNPFEIAHSRRFSLLTLCYKKIRQDVSLLHPLPFLRGAADPIEPSGAAGLEPWGACIINWPYKAFTRRWDP